MNKPNTINEVLIALDKIIEETSINNDRLGLFAYVYRRTTAEVLKEIENGKFENGERLAKMDVAFANLYLKAYYDYKDGLEIPKCWQFAFDCKKESLTILQHIMLGINAHINLDLGIATSATMKGKDITLIENDFNTINTVLFNITNELQRRLGRVSPLLFVLDLVGLKTDEQIIDFSMQKAREQSWISAKWLWSLPDHEQATAIDTIDNTVMTLSKIIKDPKAKILSVGLWLIHLFETKNTQIVIEQLSRD